MDFLSPADQYAPIFVQQDETMILSNSPSLDPDGELTDIRPSLIQVHSMDVNLRDSEVLEDITFDEVSKLKNELSKTKDELSQLTQSHLVEVKKMQSQQDVVGFIKEKEQRTSMNKVQKNYEKVNKQLVITQNLHIAELKKLRKTELAYKLELKLKNKKIKDLTEETQALTASKARMKSDHDQFLAKLKKKYEDEMEAEVNKRISRISQLNKSKNKLIEELKGRQSAIEIEMDDEIDINDESEEIQHLKREIKRLEKNNERDQNMFFKHNEIFEYKLQRETKENKELKEQVAHLKKVHEQELAELNQRVFDLKEENSRSFEKKIKLEQEIEIISEQNKSLKSKVMEREQVGHQYTTSYMSHNVENKVDLRRIGEMESIKVEQKLLIDDMQKALKETKNELNRCFMSKLELAGNFALEMNRIRNEIKRQNRVSQPAEKGESRPKAFSLFSTNY